MVLGFIIDWKIAYTVLTFALCGLYGAVIAFRLFGVLVALLRPSEHRITASEVDALQDADLPIYTVLVPMYKEPEVAQKIARTVTSLNYPIDKLDVKLLLEEDDPATRAKIDEVIDSLPHCVEVIIAPSVPKSQPRTKPRALNWGLEKARGKFVAVFDAEDQPEPDQLKKAVIAFNRLDAAGKSSTACLQAKLNYFNAHQNALTRFFTLEYTNWFDLFLPGLHAVRTPIPLGGTSNHFRVDVLQKLGGWDPFNVTEDCDLGIRLARHGYSTEILDSTTWEEANSQVNNWIKQRSRWVKGYFQTHLVHTRDAVLPMFLGAGACGMLFKILHNYTKANPDTPYNSFITWSKVFCGIVGAVALLCGFISIQRRMKNRMNGSGNGEGQLGIWHAMTFRFTIGGMSMMLLLNVVFWLMTAAYAVHGPLAAALPDAIGNIKVDETTSVRQAIGDWKLVYENVIDEDRYAGVTFWNTSRAFVTGQLGWGEVNDRIKAIDTWSLISQLFCPVAIMLFIANFVFILLGLMSCQKRGMWDLFPFAILVPFYWILISIAAIKGFYQLFTNPWYWEKTMHGLSQPEPQAQSQAPVESVGSTT